MNRVLTAMKISIVPLFILLLIYEAMAWEPIMSQDIPANIECEYKTIAEMYICDAS